MRTAIKAVILTCVVIILAGSFYLLKKDSAGQRTITKNIVALSAQAQQAAMQKAMGKAETTTQPADMQDDYNYDGISLDEYMAQNGGQTSDDELLIDGSKKPQYVDITQSATPTQAAAQSNIPGNAEVLINGSSTPEYIDVDNPAAVTSSLMTAVSANNLDQVRVILNNGANPNMADNATSSTPLFTAIANNNPDIVQLLLSSGASVTQVNDKGNMPIHEAASAGAFGSDAAFRGNEIIQMLLESGADVNEKNMSGQTPLMLACKANRGETAAFLLTLGADKNIIDNDGQTALDIAQDASSTSCVNILNRRSEQMIN